MNEAQKKIMIAVAIGLVIAFLFPPHAFFREGGGATQMGYSFIANMPKQKSVHILMLFAEWLGITVIGGILYFIARDTQLEYASPQSKGIKGSATAQLSSLDTMSKYKCQWPPELSQLRPLKLSHFSRVKMADSVLF